METKICKGCKKEFPITRETFYIDRASKDGYKSICKTCSTQKVRLTKVPKEGYKYCGKCGEELPATMEYFVKATKNKSGLASQCKTCTHEYYLDNKEKIIAKTHKYYEENREKALAQQKIYSDGKKGHKKAYDRDYYIKNFERIKSYSKEYRENNLEKITKYQRKYYKENKDRISEINNKWKENNLEKVRMARKKRKNKKKTNIATLTNKQWGQIKEDFDYTCAYCGQAVELEQDHFIPLSYDGEYSINNIIPACRSCNASKNNKEFKEWYKRQDIYSKSREKKILKYLNYKDEGIQQLMIRQL